MAYQNGKFVKLLCIIGAVIGILEVILGMAGVTSGPYANEWAGLDRLLGAIIFGIICIFMCLVILVSFNVINVNLKVVPSWLMLLIFGIVIVLFGALYGGILILIGAIVATIDAL